MNVFLIERLMCLFWIAVQQFCFACVKYAHDDIVSGAKTWRIAASQAAALVLTVVFCFEPELNLSFPSKLLLKGDMDYFPWVARIVLCGMMILFDALLMLYFYRIVRVYRRGLASARPTLPGDAALAALVTTLCCVYITAGIGASGRIGFDMSQYLWIGRFFIQISNFFYISLEAGGAFIMWTFLREARNDG